MFRKLCLIILLLILYSLCFSEYILKSSVINSSGFNSSNNRIFWSVADPVETKILQSGNNNIYSGFQYIHNNPSNIPVITVETDSVNFGNVFLFSISDDSLLVINNKGSGDFVISDLSFHSENSVFSYIYENMNIPIIPFNSDTIKINFTPIESINYIDTLYITNSSVNDSILKITLCGTGEYSPPSSPSNVQIDIQGNNSILSWSVVDTTITGIIINPDGYIILNSENPYSEFNFLSFTPDTTYVHNYVTQYRDKMFYKIVAVKSLRFEDIVFLKSISKINLEYSWKDLKLFLKRRL